jgi:transposase
MSVPLSLDLRERIVAAYRRGEGTYAEIAERFDVGEASVSRLLRRHRERGGVAPSPRGGGNRPKIASAEYATLVSFVAEMPDRTVEELRQAWQTRTATALSRSAMQRALLKAGLSRKKSGSARRNSSELMSRSADASS